MAGPRLVQAGEDRLLRVLDHGEQARQAVSGYRPVRERVRQDRLGF
jgi:hypothetical protein